MRLRAAPWSVLQSGTYGDIYNFPLAQYEKVLDANEVRRAGRDVSRASARKRAVQHAEQRVRLKTGPLKTGRPIAPDVSRQVKEQERELEEEGGDVEFVAGDEDDESEDDEGEEEEVRGEGSEGEQRE